MAALLVSAATAGCALQSASRLQREQGAILVRSSPAAGSTVDVPVDKLRLGFNPPARLDEVTLSGADGVMPMMVHAAGEVSNYSIPLPGLEAGVYTVNWRATSQGREYRGSFAFTAK